MQNTPVPLIRAGVLEPFLRAGRHIGMPVESMLEGVGLEVFTPEENPSAVLPELLVWRFISLAARREEGPLFGLRATTLLPHPDIPGLPPLLQGCLDLREVLQRYQWVVRTQSNISRHVLEEQGEWARLLEIGSRLVPDCPEVETFEVQGMIEVVQMVAGPGWRPSHIEFNCRPRPEIEQAPEFNPARILFSRPHVGIAFPRSLLALPVDAGSEPLPPEEKSGFPRDFAEQLREALASCLGARSPDRRLATEIAGIPLRTLQRRLASAGTSWREVVERARHQRARELLRDSCLTLTDIAQEVGYAHLSTFSQAFRRHAGITPREYRRQYGETPVPAP